MRRTVLHLSVISSGPTICEYHFITYQAMCSLLLRRVMLHGCCSISREHLHWRLGHYLQMRQSTYRPMVSPGYPLWLGIRGPCRTRGRPLRVATCKYKDVGQRVPTYGSRNARQIESSPDVLPPDHNELLGVEWSLHQLRCSLGGKMRNSIHARRGDPGANCTISNFSGNANAGTTLPELVFHS